MDVGDLRPTPKRGLGFNMSASPGLVTYMRALNVHVAGMANNHAYDFGAEGVRRTLAALARAGIRGCGARAVQDGDPCVVVLRQRGSTVGLWAAANNTHEQAGRRQEGIEPASRARAKRAHARLIAQGATCTIALIHAGLEGTSYPDPADKRLLDDIAAVGFDVVAACHSHRISGARLPCAGSAPRAVFYGLGSLSSQICQTPVEREGLIAIVDLDASGCVVAIGVVPVVLDSEGWGSDAKPVPGHAILDRFTDISEAIESGAYKARFYDDVAPELWKAQALDVWLALRNGGLRAVLAKLTRLRARHLVRAYRALRSPRP
jgi:poly-gamma-glutamate synthesis protein (capsule biosynthesis protein)